MYLHILDSLIWDLDRHRSRWELRSRAGCWQRWPSEEESFLHYRNISRTKKIWTQRKATNALKEFDSGKKFSRIVTAAKSDKTQVEYCFYNYGGKLGLDKKFQNLDVWSKCSQMNWSSTWLNTSEQLVRKRQLLRIRLKRYYCLINGIMQWVQRKRVCKINMKCDSNFQ